MKENINNNSRADILVEALPYIQRYRGKIIVVKYGGNAMVNDELKAKVIQDLVLMNCVGIRTVLVHGGGPEIDDMLKKTGKDNRFVNGLRYTDTETMEVVQMVLCGKINKDITCLIQEAGAKAIGICGIDGAMLKARRIKDADYGLVGEIEEVDTSILISSLDSGFIPVVSSVAYGIGDDLGQSLNVNADTAAAKIAAALQAEKLVLMTDVPGIMRDIGNPESLVKSTSIDELKRLKKEGVISKGMIPKVDCCIYAINGGVKKANILDGRVSHAILVELFTDEGVGTIITA